MTDLSPALWQPLLTTRTLGRAVSHFEHTLTSTNAILKDMARQGAPHGCVCLCEQQTAGRGRLDRTWTSPDGQGIWMSVLLRPKLPPEACPLITFAVALAMHRALEDVCGVDARIKWPNDLVVDGRKICGILLEMGFDANGLFIIAGAGLNVRRGAYPAELAERAVSLEECTAAVPDRGAVIASFLAHLEAALTALEQGGFAAISTGYRAASITLGSRVHVIGAEDFIGTAEDIDDSGALLVRDDSGALRRVLAGDVSVRGVMGYV